MMRFTEVEMSLKLCFFYNEPDVRVYRHSIRKTKGLARECYNHKLKNLGF